MSESIAPSDQVTIRIDVNGTEQEATVPARRLLLDFLRDELGLTGTVAGCEHGVCGACTVLLDDRPVRSCLMLTVQADRASVTTIEGLDATGRIGALQRAFHEHHGLQCGFCTSGILVTVSAADPAEYPDEASVRELLSGNLCRCTGYHNIVEAVMAAWEGAE